MAALAFTGAGVMAQEPPRKVEVKGMRDPQMQAYRSVWAGLDAFDKYRHLAPLAPALQFHLRPRWDNPGASIKGITLDIVGKKPTAEVLKLAVGEPLDVLPI